MGSDSMPLSLRELLRQAASAETAAAKRAASDKAHDIARATGIQYPYVAAAIDAGIDLDDSAALREFATAESNREAEDARTASRAGLVEATTARIPPRYADAVADHPDVLRWVSDLTESARRTARAPGHDALLTGPSLLLTGPVGTGKTHQAYGAVRALAEHGVNTGWKMISAADMYGALRPRAGVDSETELRRFMSARLLIIDDLGAAKDSEWTEEINYRVVNHRYEQTLATCVITNATPRQLAERVGQRVASRLSEMTTVAAIIGADRRRKAQGAA